MRNIVGSPVRYTDVYPRDGLIALILSQLLRGQHVNMTGPRRVGKTTISHALCDLQPYDHVYAYSDTQSINTESQFFRKVYFDVVSSLQKYGSVKKKIALQQSRSFFEKIESISIINFEIRFFKPDGRPDYKEALFDLLKEMELPSGRQLIIILDEFTQTLKNIVGAKDPDAEAALHFLQSNRELRIHPLISRKVKFIVSGSVSLQRLVSELNCDPFINDLSTVPVGALPANDARDLLQRLLSYNDMDASVVTCNYLLEKIGWLIPFHIQSIVKQLAAARLPGASRLITIEAIDHAFGKMLHDPDNQLRHYYNRLLTQYSGAQLNYILKVLETLARKEDAHRTTLYNMAQECKVHPHGSRLLDDLAHEGYINNIDDENCYRFNSPLIKAWWLRFACK